MGTVPVRPFVPVVIVSLGMLGTLAGRSAGREWLVLPDGSGDAPTIQAAVDSTAPGDTVLAGPGTFVEQVNVSQTQGLTLRGMSGPEITTIDAGGVGYTVAGTELSGFLLADLRLVGALSSGYGYGGYGFHADGSAAVRGCVLESSVDFSGTLEMTGCEMRSTGTMFFGGENLLVEGCLFQGNYGTVVQIWWQNGNQGVPTTAIVRRNVFRSNRYSEEAVVGYDCDFFASLDLQVTGNLFLDNDAPGVGEACVGVTRTARTGGGAKTITIDGNTFAGNHAYSLGLPNIPLPPGTTIRRNVITGAPHGLCLGPGWEAISVSCNLSWANGVNWEGFPDPTLFDGNFSEPPRYCNAAAGDFTLAADSPCLPGNNDCGVLLGALGQGCDPVSIRPVSWSRIKAWYGPPPR